jgi:hypothetical protein
MFFGSVSLESTNCDGLRTCTPMPKDEGHATAKVQHR